MSLDERIKTDYQPRMGCHSDFEKYMPKPRNEPCDYPNRDEERACEKCERKSDAAK